MIDWECDFYLSVPSVSWVVLPFSTNSQLKVKAKKYHYYKNNVSILIMLVVTIAGKGD